MAKLTIEEMYRHIDECTADLIGNFDKINVLNDRLRVLVETLMRFEEKMQSISDVVNKQVVQLSKRVTKIEKDIGKIANEHASIRAELDGQGNVLRSDFEDIKTRIEDVESNILAQLQRDYAHSSSVITQPSLLEKPQSKTNNLLEKEHIK